MVDERDRVERRAEEDDLAGALDDARVGRAIPVPVVERVGSATASASRPTAATPASG